VLDRSNLSVKKIRKRGGFTLAATLAVCVILMALSAGLLMRTTQARLGMRTAAVANQYHMSMDNMLRTFGTMASEMAVLGGDGKPGGSALSAFGDTTAMQKGITQVLPAEWTNSPIVQTDVTVVPWNSPTTGGGVTIIGAPNLMKDQAKWQVMDTKALRSSILPPDQKFAGRSWGYKAEVKVNVKDNLEGIETSWGRRKDSSEDHFISHGSKSIYTNSAAALMVVTEIPSQFSVQGQNLQLKTNAGQTINIGKGKGATTNSSTILGRTVDMSAGLFKDIAKSTKVVARGGIVSKGKWAQNAITDKKQILAREAVAGAGAETDLEEAGSAVLVNVGTRGKEIFRSPEDYASVITGLNRGQRVGDPQVSDFLRYWLPYYQCNFRVTFHVDADNVRHTGVSKITYQMSDVFFTRTNHMSVPMLRTNSSSLATLHSGFAGVDTAVTAHGKVGLLPLAARRPFSSVMRTTKGTSAPGAIKSTNWVNTIDIDLESFFDILDSINTTSLGISPADWKKMPVGLHIDIKRKTSGGDPFYMNAEEVPVVIRRAGVLRRPFSIVTPGTVHIPGDFGSSSVTGKPPVPFSIFAPKVKFGMEGRQPRNASIKGQRIGVGGGTNRESAVLDVLAGTGKAANSADNRLSNIKFGGGSGTAANPAEILPPVFLKDWLIETYSDF